MRKVILNTVQVVSVHHGGEGMAKGLVHGNSQVAAANQEAEGSPGSVARLRPSSPALKDPSSSI